MAKPPWNDLYSSRRWRALRHRHLDKDPLCCMCQAEGRTTIATICDHIEPHRGDMVKFWHGPFQSLCAPHHSSVKQSQEKGGSKTTLRPTIGLDGWPV